MYRKIHKKENYRNKWKKITDTILKALYPPRCILCDAVLPVKTGGICRQCEQKLPWVKEPFCLKCGKPVEHESMEYCRECRRTMHSFTQGAAVFTYSGPIRHAVTRMKYQNRRDYISCFSSVMAARTAEFLALWRPELIIPVPMHPKKRRKRGYDQAKLLAEELSYYLQIPLGVDVVRNVRYTRDQKTLDRQSRLQNLKNSFRVCADLSGISRVLLVDDVYTTGSTMEELARTLKENGVKNIYFIVLCIGKG